MPPTTSSVPRAMGTVMRSPRKKIATAALHSGTEARIGPLRAAPIFSMPI